MSDVKIKIKNDEPGGKSLRIQFWNGKIPTYDDEHQRAVAAKNAIGLDILGNEITSENDAPVTPYAKMLKADLLALCVSLSIKVDENDTKATLLQKLYDVSPAPVRPVPLEEQPQAYPEITYDFSVANLLQESTLSSGEEKILTLSTGIFITIKHEG